MNVCYNNLDGLSAAMPIINSVHILIEAPLRASAFGSPPLPAPSEEPFFSFLAAWVAKVGQLTCKITERSTNNDKVCQLIAQCTNLQRAEVHENPRVLEAVLMHRVSELTVHCDANETALTAPIARWLASDCAVRLTLYRFGVGDCTGLARAIATSPTLSHLALRESSAVRAGIVANGLMLRHVTHFEYFTLPGYHRFEAALAMLNLGSLVKLVLGGQSAYATDLSCLLPALPHLSALDELQLFDISMDARPATHQTWTVAPRVRYIKLHDVRFSVESRRAILEWAGRSDRLDILRWPNCAASDRNGSFVGDDLQRIIQAGVRTIHCDWQLDQRDIAALTKGIHGSHAPRKPVATRACYVHKRRH
ncbi:hypothetical protein SPRG_00080 [Saprolegnia parasitica CBS 223.65]|uniref:F-box domain-containing protein n=1 Tax=Saprolegnia parasitica (strain CBS 223.65) TaxID=695850 RepID=A0A067D180_SAPPC|nr:hypothetical protein SPRG_00080 [Saprolegnia parasitica CBS 223.65]KDO35235.1 hypothetical protein SPRG_00080 [Saprolegnia parasitica CBS 223.65]|eukprot:XP_012193586.1 hypothetical protein SPRG_00080 [Saprolegnia parasitica CBS 223.65]